MNVLSLEPPRNVLRSCFKCPLSLLLSLAISFCSVGYFYWWVILSMMWGILATLVATLLPIIESSEVILGVFGLGPAKHHKHTTEDSDSNSDIKKVQVQDVPMPGDDTAHKGSPYNV